VYVASPVEPELISFTDQKLAAGAMNKVMAALEKGRSFGAGSKS